MKISKKIHCTIIIIFGHENYSFRLTTYLDDKGLFEVNPYLINDV